MTVHKFSANDVVCKGTKNVFKVRMYRSNSHYCIFIYWQHTPMAYMGQGLIKMRQAYKMSHTHIHTYT